MWIAKQKNENKSRNDGRTIPSKLLYLLSANRWRFSHAHEIEILEIAAVSVGQSILDADQKYRFSRDEIVCGKCMYTLNRYDLAWLTATRIEQEIRDAIIVTDQTYRQ